MQKGMAIYSSILAWRIPQTEEPWGHTESDTTEPLTHIDCVKANINDKHYFPQALEKEMAIYPLQDYCLENPMDRGAW